MRKCSSETFKTMENRAKSFSYPKRNEITVINGIKIFNHKPEGQRYYYFCCEVNISLISSKKEYYRCRYNSTKDQFNFNHDHVFTVNITGENDFNEEEVIEGRVFSLHEAVSSLTVELNLSIISASSDAMRSFIHLILSKGFLFARQNPLTTVQDIPKVKLDSRHIRQEIINIANNAQKKISQFTSEYEYFAVTFDAATIKKRKALFYCCSNPNYSSEHLLMGSEEMIFSWDSQNYFDWAKKMVELYRNISAFVGDGLPAGISGIAHFHTDGYLALTQGTQQIFSPCYSHILNLSFKKSAESCNIISETIDQIDFLIMVLNKPFVKEQTKKKISHDSQDKMALLL